jgi:nitroreductase
MIMTNSVFDAIENRRTTNKYDSSRNIGDAQISELVRLATRAPTAFHLQNWRFIAVKTPEAKARLRKLALDQPKVTEAAVTFIVVGQLASHLVMAERLASSVAAGFMPADVVTGSEGAGSDDRFDPRAGQRYRQRTGARCGHAFRQPREGSYFAIRSRRRICPRRWAYGPVATLGWARPDDARPVTTSSSS